MQMRVGLAKPEGICSVKTEADSIAQGTIFFYDDKDREENVIRIKFLIEKPMDRKLESRQVISSLVSQQSLRWRMLSYQNLATLFSGVDQSDSEFRIDIESIVLE